MTASAPRARLLPPSGEPAPVVAVVSSGESIALLPLAEEVCRRYIGEFPDERERYGDAGQAWCLHDNLYLLAWAVDDADGSLEMSMEVAWLARVLESRGFPLDRLARTLDIGSEVVRLLLDSPLTEKVATALTQSADHVRSEHTFLD